MKYTNVIYIVFVLLMLSQSAMAVTIRYALIIGNDIGADADGSRPFTSLQHAEREAAELKKKLVKYSSFDPSNLRTRLLLGATRDEIRAAVRSLARKKNADQEVFGKINSLFLFYFTGHGLDGRLLLKDGALTADEIGSFFTDFDADFSIGIFDSCYSGSLDRAALKSKSINSAPALNLFREMPEEVLSAEGSIWYVSSSSDQESYEDERLGGVFTHFFMEALERAETNGPGITLDSIWQYTRANTIEYTAQRKRMQVPEQYIANLRSNAPIYFSFPMARTSTLILSEALEGRFALTYKHGNLIEVFEKQRGDERKLAVYPGNARLILVGSENKVTSRSIKLNPQTTLVLSSMKDSSPLPVVGQQAVTLFEKGSDVHSQVTATRIEPGISVLGGLGYSFDIAHEQLLYARHGFSLPVRLDIGRAIVGASIQYGYDKQSYAAWTHVVHEMGGKLTGGYAFDFNSFRLGVAAAFGAAYLKQIYPNGQKRDGWQYRPMLETSLLYPRSGYVQGELFADLGAIYTPGVGNTSDSLWRLTASVGLSLYFRLY